MRVVAAALSVGLTAFGMVATDHVHAPAGSTTLLISLGIFRTLGSVGVLIGAVSIVALLTALTATLTRPAATRRSLSGFTGGDATGLHFHLREKERE